MNEENDIVIVGIGCMFFGVENIEEFWNVLKNGEDYVQEILLERFDVDVFFDVNFDYLYKMYVRKVGLIKW